MDIFRENEWRKPRLSDAVSQIHSWFDRLTTNGTWHLKGHSAVRPERVEGVNGGHGVSDGDTTIKDLMKICSIVKLP